MSIFTEYALSLRHSWLSSYCIAGGACCPDNTCCDIGTQCAASTTTSGMDYERSSQSRNGRHANLKFPPPLRLSHRCWYTCYFDRSQSNDNGSRSGRSSDCITSSNSCENYQGLSWSCEFGQSCGSNVTALRVNAPGLVRIRVQDRQLR